MRACTAASPSGLTPANAVVSFMRILPESSSGSVPHFPGNCRCSTSTAASPRARVRENSRVALTRLRRQIVHVASYGGHFMRKVKPYKLPARTEEDNRAFLNWLSMRVADDGKHCHP